MGGEQGEGDIKWLQKVVNATSAGSYGERRQTKGRVKPYFFSQRPDKYQLIKFQITIFNDPNMDLKRSIFTIAYLSVVLNFGH
jgi:hypothetical protein